MNFFIDFEATQFSQEIISVGCVREDGETFYSLCAPVKGEITPHITNLTGITAEMLSTALTPDAVFSSFYDWVFGSDNCPTFYVWGNCDNDFAKHTFKRTTNFNARLMLGYLCAGIGDYSQYFKKKAKTKNNIGLIKVFNALVDETVTQNHNALDDAMLLYEVWKVESNLSPTALQAVVEKVLPAAFKNQVSVKKVPPQKWVASNFEPGTICALNSKLQVVKSFADIEEAAKFLLDNKFNNFTKDNTPEAALIERRITNAIRSNKSYFSFRWRKC